MKDCLVIGGGPIGLYTAGLVARAGYEVDVVEEHQKIGEPVQCSGIVTPRVMDFVPETRNTIRSTKKGADVYSTEHSISFKGTEVKAVVIDRAEFDNVILNWARDRGVNVYVSTSLAGRNGRKPVLKGKLNGTMEHKVIVGADGPNSLTARLFGLDCTGIKFLAGWQVEAVVNDYDDIEKVRIWLGRRFAPGFFAWGIPVEETDEGLLCRIGLGVHPELLDRPLAHYGKALLKPDYIIKSTQGGIIPIGSPAETVSGNVILVGDSAAQVKPTSGGGLFPGLRSAKIAADAIINTLESSDNRKLKLYEKQWRTKVGTELAHGMKFHRILLSMKDSEIDDVIRQLGKKDLIGTIVKKGDIDYPWKVAWVVIRKAPGLLKYIPRAVNR